MPTPPLDSSKNTSGGFARLFDPGERLGWIFRDSTQFLKNFNEPRPAPIDMPAPSPSAPRVGELIKVGAVFTIVGLVFLGFDTTMGVLTLVVGLIVLIGIPSAQILNYRSAVSDHEAKVLRLEHMHATAVMAWEKRSIAYVKHEEERIRELPEWGAVTVQQTDRRIDIYGGTLDGWRGLLITYAASVLGSEKSFTLLDLSNETVSAELIGLAGIYGYDVSVDTLPEQLAERDLLTGLDSSQLVDVLIESVHGDESSGTMSVRAKDSRILNKICDALKPRLTLKRVGEALRVLLGEMPTSEVLTQAEREHIVRELFSAEYIQGSFDSFSRIEAHVHPLEELGTRVIPDASTAPPSRARVFQINGDGPNARNELLANLLLQWTMRSVAAPGSAGGGSLIVAGADAVRRHDLERLSDICERNGTRLVYLFRHLRDTSLNLLGGGAVGFMRLGNHEEADRAASFIGKEHTYVLSQVTANQDSSASVEVTDSSGKSDAKSVTTTTGFSERTVTTDDTYIGTHSSSVSRSANEGLSKTVQRVYEYRMEPSTLQHLPGTALLLVRSESNRPVAWPTDCNPNIVNLPRVVTHALDPVDQSAPPAITPNNRKTASAAHTKVDDVHKEHEQ